jgi:hypothetical protein
VINANSQFSAPAKLVSFAIPTVTSLEGCVPDAKVPGSVLNCQRHGQCLRFNVSSLFLTVVVCLMQAEMC